ncbi:MULTISPECIES: PEP-CTERM sorting domain-containing protein, partial [Streptomyces]
LTRGTVYSVSFSYAAAQWSLNKGATTETLQVSLGGSTRQTTTYNLPSQGFSGWLSQTFTFMYDGTAPTLKFLATGTPAGEPPMILLDGVTMFDVPEPAAIAGLLSGCAVLARVRRRRL